MSFKVARWNARKKAEEVASYMGVSVTTVSQWENGGYLPTADKLQKLAQFYGCTMEELMEGNPQKDVRGAN